MSIIWKRTWQYLERARLTMGLRPASSIDVVEMTGAVGREGGLLKGLPAVDEGDATVKIIKKGVAMRVVFFYPGEEGTYVDQAQVTLYEGGLVHIQSATEETTTHVQHCEILWRYEVTAQTNAAERSPGLVRGKERLVRLVKQE